MRHNARRRGTSCCTSRVAPHTSQLAVTAHISSEPPFSDFESCFPRDAGGGQLEVPAGAAGRAAGSGQPQRGVRQVCQNGPENEQTQGGAQEIKYELFFV